MADTQTIAVPVALLVLIAERVVDRMQKRNGHGPVASDRLRVILREEQKQLAQDLEVIRERMHDIGNRLQTILAYIEMDMRNKK